MLSQKNFLHKVYGLQILFYYQKTHSHVAKNIFFGSIGTLLNFPPQLFCTVVNYTSVRK